MKMKPIQFFDLKIDTMQLLDKTSPAFLYQQVIEFIDYQQKTGVLLKCYFLLNIRIFITNAYNWQKIFLFCHFFLQEKKYDKLKR